VYGILHGEPTPARDFLHCLARAVVRADDASYAALRNGLMQIKQRFPQYKCECPTEGEEETPPGE
jgi:hypothetical protein